MKRKFISRAQAAAIAFAACVFIAWTAPAALAMAVQDAKAGEPHRVGGDIKPPICTKMTKPVYPPIAIRQRVQGVVITEVVISTTGKVEKAKVLRSIAMLDDAALTAVKRREYKPTLIDGKPVSVVMTVPINFVLD